jgi:hypothetical protein
MSKIEKILIKFEDFELAFLVKYKLDSYMEPTRNAIIAELNKRKLTKQKIDQYINALENTEVEPDGVMHCPRCTSTKIAADQVEYWNTNKRNGLSDEVAILDSLNGKQTYKQKLTCMVCDYVLFDPNDGGAVGLSDVIGGFLNRIFGRRG